MRIIGQPAQIQQGARPGGATRLGLDHRPPGRVAADVLHEQRREVERGQLLLQPGGQHSPSRLMPCRCRDSRNGQLLHSPAGVVMKGCKAQVQLRRYQDSSGENAEQNDTFVSIKGPDLHKTRSKPLGAPIGS